jgi:L-2-hydroxyglutarate oxidase LhgO
MSVDCEITIIGSGIIGLAIASALSKDKRNVYILEKNTTHGMGISSRNSEVVHAGIYDPPGSLKARLCVEGRELLYETCARNNIPHQKIGKLIIATTVHECQKLEQLKSNGEQNGVSSLSLVDEAMIRDMEPHVSAVAGLHSPDTGIFSVHHLMEYYLHNAKQGGADIAYGTAVTGISRVSEGYRITTKDPSGDPFEFVSEQVVNAAGLHSDTIAGMLGKEYSLHYCKGDYFSVNNVKKGTVRRLVYPVPEVNHVGLGVHLTLDLSGRIKLGPDTTYVEKNEDYRVDAAKRDAFYDSAVRFLPFLKREDVVPEMSGIRPKLQGPGEGLRDFVISEDFPGFVNLVGIESPGLTAAPAIARYVSNILTGKSVSV